MNLTGSVILLVLVAAGSALSLEQQAQSVQESNQKLEARQGKSVGANYSSGNSITNGNSNVIEHHSTSSKAALAAEKRTVAEFMTPKNILKTIVKLLFGNQDEVAATSRNVLSVLGKMLDLLKSTFGQKARVGTARTIRDSAEDAANAGVSMIQGYVRSVLAGDESCMQRHLCEASSVATRDGRELGYLIASVGGYASSYLLDSAKSANFKRLYDASMKGRANIDCTKQYPNCSEPSKTADE